jgi:hypothetical protein
MQQHDDIFVSVKDDKKVEILSGRVRLNTLIKERKRAIAVDQYGRLLELRVSPSGNSLIPRFLPMQGPGGAAGKKG